MQSQYDALNFYNESFIQPQGKIITALREYARLNSQRPLVSDGGICAALAICFAFSHLALLEEGYLTPAVFNDFMKNFNELSAVSAFFVTLETLTQQYQKTHEPHNKQILLQELRPMWAQLAIVDFAIVLYNQNKKYPTYLLPNNNEITLGFMGLKSVAALSLAVELERFETFLFPKGGSTQSPFVPGGTYLVNFPDHLCALHITPKGKVLFYDPNHDEKIISPRQVNAYKNLLKKYARDLMIPVDIIAVEMINKYAQKVLANNTVEAIQHQFLLCGSDYLALSHLTVEQSIRTLCHIVTPQSQERFQNILKTCPPQQCDTLIKIVIRTLVLKEEFSFFQLMVLEPSFLASLENNQFWIGDICQHRKIDLLIFALEHLPAKFCLQPSAHEILKMITCLEDGGERCRLKQLIEVLVTHTAMAPGYDSQGNLLFFIRKFPPKSPVVIRALQAWQQECHNTQTQKTLYLSPAQSLLAYFLHNDYPASLITTLLASNAYLWAECDYEAVLSSKNHEAQTILKSQKSQIPRALLPHEALFIASDGDSKAFDMLLQSQPPLSEAIVKKCFRCAIINQHVTVCDQILKNNCQYQTFSFLQPFIRLTVEQDLAKSAHFLIGKLTHKERKKAISFCWMICFLEGKKEMALEIQQHYDIKPDILRNSWLREKMQEKKSYPIAALDIVLQLGATKEQLSNTSFWPKSPLNTAIYAGDLPLVEQLLRQGVPISQKWPRDHHPLSLCAFTGDTEIAHCLLLAGADINALDDQGHTAAYYAVYHGDHEMLSLLIDHGIDFNISGQPDRVPLFLTVLYKNYALFNRLLKNGAEPTDLLALISVMKNRLTTPGEYQKWENTLIEKTIIYDKTRVLESFKANGLNINIRTLDYQGLLWYMIFSQKARNLELFLLLTSENIDLNITHPIQGTTPLITAITQGNLTIVTILLQHHACPHFAVYPKMPPIYYAAQEENVPMVRLLMDYGADYNNHPEILYDAIEQQNILLVSTLLRSLPSHHEILMSAFKRAQETHNQEIIDLLEQAMITGAIDDSPHILFQIPPPNPLVKKSSKD